MPFADLARLTGRHDIRALAPTSGAPLRIEIVCNAQISSLSLAALVQPLQMAAQRLGSAHLQVSIVSLRDALASPAAHGQMHLLVGELLDVVDVDGVETAVPTSEQCRRLMAHWQGAAYVGVVGAAVLWLARAGCLQGVRLALPWSLYSQADEVAERAILTPQLYECDGRILSCCGGAACLDFSLTLIDALYGPGLQSEIKEALCVEVVRGPAERQRVALQARFGVLQPKLTEAVSLMEANLEEPLTTDDIAGLVGISRRQLERLFKQFLGSVPSRYYLELRLQRARKLLLESNDSIVQVGLMCGFSSGSHFSTAYGALFGMTPRDERQRKLRNH